MKESLQKKPTDCREESGPALQVLCKVFYFNKNLREVYGKYKVSLWKMKQLATKFEMANKE